MQTFVGAVFVVHYWLIGAAVGMVLNCIVIIRNIFYYFRNQKGKQGIVMPIVFAVIMAIAGVLTFGEWFSLRGGNRHQYPLYGIL